MATQPLTAMPPAGSSSTCNRSAGSTAAMASCASRTSCCCFARSGACWACSVNTSVDEDCAFIRTLHNTPINNSSNAMAMIHTGLMRAPQRVGSVLVLVLVSVCAAVAAVAAVFATGLACGLAWAVTCLRTSVGVSVGVEASPGSASCSDCAEAVVPWAGRRCHGSSGAQTVSATSPSTAIPPSGLPPVGASKASSESVACGCSDVRLQRPACSCNHATTSSPN